MIGAAAIAATLFAAAFMCSVWAYLVAVALGIAPAP